MTPPSASRFPASSSPRLPRLPARTLLPGLAFASPPPVGVH